MITNNDAQAAWVAWLKANASILALSSTFPVEIREEHWQGEVFSYPNIRIACEITGGECIDDCLVTISCFSEEKSSKESQTISATVANAVHNKPFTQSNLRFSAIRAKTLRAVQENGVWKADVQVNTKVK